MAIGPSDVRWDCDQLVIDIDEICAPWPSRIRGQVRIHPTMLSDQVFELDENGRHVWQPIAPRARVEVGLHSPSLSWSGSGYLDTNAGSEPLEHAFTHWDWLRAECGSGAAVLYDVRRRSASPLTLALRCDQHGNWEPADVPRAVALPSTLWRIPRGTHADDDQVRVLRTVEDGPFYARSLLATTLFGTQTTAVHETVSLDRFSRPWVKALLPFRMPRAIL